MHNLYMGTAKYISNGVWMKKNILTSSDLQKIKVKKLAWVIPPEVSFARLPASIEHCSPNSG